MDLVLPSLTERCSSAQAPTVLLDIANGPQAEIVDDQLLPEYGILPAAAIVALNTLALFFRGGYQEEDPLRLSFNSTVQTWQEMSRKSFFLLPALVPAEGGIMSMAFLDSSLVQIWQLRDKPTREKTYAMLVGLAGRGQLPLCIVDWRSDRCSNSDLLRLSVRGVRGSSD